MAVDSSLNLPTGGRERERVCRHSTAVAGLREKVLEEASHATTAACLLLFGTLNLCSYLRLFCESKVVVARDFPTYTAVLRKHFVSYRFSVVVPVCPQNAHQRAIEPPSPIYPTAVSASDARRHPSARSCFVVETPRKHLSIVHTSLPRIRWCAGKKRLPTRKS